MKKLLSFSILIIAMTVILIDGVMAGFSINSRQALQTAIQDAAEDIAKDPSVNKNQTIAIMPVTNDDEYYVEGLLKTALTKAGFKCVELRNSEFWEEIQKQLAWDTKKADLVDPDTLLELKKLMGTQNLMYGVVREASQDIQKVYVETEFHMSSLETTQHVWGGIFAQRDYLTAETDGIVDLGSPVKSALENVVKGASASMKAAPKLSDTKSMVVVTIAGDIQNYVKGLLFEVMTNQTDFYPRDLGVKTLAEARQMLRAEPDKADAVLYGSIRDLSRKLKSDLPLKQIYTISAEIQFTVQNVQTGDILWSITQSDIVEEVIEKPKEEAAYDWAKENTSIIKWILTGIGIALVILLIAFFTRPRKRR